MFAPRSRTVLGWQRCPQAFDHPSAICGRGQCVSCVNPVWLACQFFAADLAYRQAMYTPVLVRKSAYAAANLVYPLH